VQTLVFEAGVMLVVEMENPPSKTSADTRFRGRCEAAGGKHHTTNENEHLRSFLKVV
jgi:hypothetical protein